VTINSYVERLAVGVVRKSPMRMAVEMPCAFVRPVPNPKRIMTEDNALSIHLDLIEVLIGLQLIIVQLIIPDSRDKLIVVPLNIMNGSIESPENSTNITKVPSQRKVTKMKHYVIGSDLGVPIGNKGFIVFPYALFGNWKGVDGLNVFGLENSSLILIQAKSPESVLDDVAMVKVGITCKEYPLIFCFCDSH